MAFKRFYKADEYSVESALNAGACRNFPLDKQGMVVTRLNNSSPVFDKKASKKTLNA